MRERQRKRKRERDKETEKERKRGVLKGVREGGYQYRLARRTLTIVVIICTITDSI